MYHTTWLTSISDPRLSLAGFPLSSLSPLGGSGGDDPAAPSIPPLSSASPPPKRPPAKPLAARTAAAGLPKAQAVRGPTRAAATARSMPLDQI